MLLELCEALERIAKLANYVSGKPVLMLLLIMLFAVIFRISILYPSYANGMPAGYDNYAHAGQAYLIAKGGLAASPATLIYPPIFLILLASLYQLTGILPIYLVVPVGIIIDILYIPPIFYISKKISGNDKRIGFLAAFFTAINPISMILLIIGAAPELFATLGILVIICILVSSQRDRSAGIIVAGLFGAFVFLTNILAAAFYVFFVGTIIVYEVILTRERHYSKPLFLSLMIAAPIAAIFYVPRISNFYVGVLTGIEYVMWALPTITVTLILIPPIAFLLKPSLREKYIVARGQHLKLLELWYLTTPLMGLALVWQVAVVSRLWHFITFPVIVVLAMVFVSEFNLAKKVRNRRNAERTAAVLLVACAITVYFGGVMYFPYAFHATPERLNLMNWIETHISLDARFCTEEEYLPTHLGWYITGLTGRMAYESMTSFSGTFEVGTYVARSIQLANNITTLTAGSTYWVQAINELRVTFVVLLASSSHPNYLPISNRTVYPNPEYPSSVYIVYNVTEYVFP